MKIKPARLDKKYGKVILYLPELQAIYDQLTSHSNKVSITNEDHEFESRADFKENFKGGNNINFDLKDTENSIAISVSVNQFAAYINVGSGDNSNVPIIVHNLDSIIKKCQRKKYDFITPGWIVALGLAYLFTLFNRLTYNSQNAKILDPIIFILTVILSVCFLIISRKSKIILTHREDDKNIFERTKDDIFSNVLGSIIVAVIGFVAGIIATKLGFFDFIK